MLFELLTLLTGAGGGTLAADRTLHLIPERHFRKIESALIPALGLVTILLIDSGRK